jgi:hypothetical protein
MKKILWQTDELSLTEPDNPVALYVTDTSAIIELRDEMLFLDLTDEIKDFIRTSKSPQAACFDLAFLPRFEPYLVMNISDDAEWDDDDKLCLK